MTITTYEPIYSIYIYRYYNRLLFLSPIFVSSLSPFLTSSVPPSVVTSSLGRECKVRDETHDRTERGRDRGRDAGRAEGTRKVSGEPTTSTLLPISFRPVSPRRGRAPPDGTVMSGKGVESDGTEGAVSDRPSLPITCHSILYPIRSAEGT